MSGNKLTDRTLFGGVLSSADLLHIVDVSDSSQDPAGSSYKIQLGQLAAYFYTGNTLGVVLGNGNNTAGNDMIVDDADYLYVGTSQNGYYHYNSASTRTELKNTSSDDLIYMSNAGGITAMLNSGQFMRLESGQFLVYGNASGTAKIQTSSTSNLIYNPTANYFNAPDHFFTGNINVSSETASTIPWLNGSKVLKSSNMTSDGNWIYFPGNYGVDVITTVGSDVLNIGTSNADVINIGWSGANINIIGNVFYENVTQLQVKDKLFTVNKGGAVASGVSAGFEIEEGGSATGYFATNGSRDGWDFKAPAISGVATLSLSALTANRTYTGPDASGTILLSTTIGTYGFIQGGNAFGATATLGTTDNYNLNIITNNTTVARFTTAGAFETNGGNSTSSDVAIHQTAASAAGSARILDVYNASYSKQMLAILDSGSAGFVMLANNVLTVNAYTAVSTFSGTAVIRATTAGADIIAINPSTGIGGIYANDASTGNPYFYGQNSTASTTLYLTTSGVSYFAGGALDVRATAGTGYLGLTAQGSNPSAPSSAGFRLFAGATGSFNWARNNGVSDTYVRTFDATLTANRTYTLQDASSTIAMYSNNLSVFASTTSAQLASVLSDETGTGFVVYSDSPTFTTQIITPKIYGSSASGGTLNIDSTSNSTKGILSFGTAGANNVYNWNVGTSTSLITFRSKVGSTTQSAIYMGVASGSETSTNYVLNWDGSLRINAHSTTSSMNFSSGGTVFLSVTPAGSVSNSFYDFQVRARSSLTTLTNIPVFNVGAQTSTWAAGTVPLQYMYYFRTQTMAFASASTTTYVSGLTVEYTTRGSNATFTTTSAIYIPTAAYTSTTTAIGIDIEAPTGATNNYALRLGGDVKVNGAYNFILDTTTGSKIGTATSQKLGFYNAAPIVQPANTVAIDDVLVNLGLRASGGSANFSLKITNNLPQNLKNYTVATLPAGTQGDIAYVTDALTPTFLVAVVGGGTIKTPVFYDGTNWVTF